MSKHFRYLSYVVRHKWFVFVAGLQTGAPLWRLLIHDWSKFNDGEWTPYVDQFYGLKREAWIHWRSNQLFLPHQGQPSDYADRHAEAEWPAEEQRRRDAFDRAWNHHQKANDHHWQYWLLTEDRPSDRHARFLIQSPDCISAYCLVEAGFEKESATRVEVWLEGTSIMDDQKDNPIGSKRLNLAQRCVDAANRSRPLEMPERCIREMVADWMGAGRAITGRWEVREWYAKNKHLIILHPETRARVEALLPA